MKACEQMLQQQTHRMHQDVAAQAVRELSVCVSEHLRWLMLQQAITATNP